MIVTAWNNGSHHKSGAGYGLRVQYIDRKRYFKKKWGSIFLELEGITNVIQVNIDKSTFWQPEHGQFIKKEIGQWLRSKGLAPWKKRLPPKLSLEPLSKNRFKVLIQPRPKMRRGVSNNIETEIESVRVSQRNNQRVVIIKEKGQERYLPVSVEPAEADAIALKLQNVPTARPLIHDLLCSLIQAFGGKVRLAVIHDFHKDTYFAKLVLGIRRKNFEFDCRPSDAIAVALRVKAPICVESSILDKFGTSIHQIGEFH